MIRRGMALLAITGGAITACDIPTGMPMWEQTWVIPVPGGGTEFSVAELLPAGITLNEDATAFRVQAPGTSLTISLGEMCGAACTTFDGVTAPKPEFRDTLTTSTALPAELVSATLSGGGFAMTMAHNFDFDPLNPSADPAEPKGMIGITVRSNGNTVADTTISGETTQFDAGTSLSPSLPIQPVVISNDLQIEIRIYSPAGDDATLRSSDTLGITLEPSTLEFSEATVSVGSTTLDPTTTPMDFEGIEEDGFVIDAIQSGALRFDIHNPFSITGSLDFEFRLPGQTIQRSLSIAEGDYEARIEFDAEELRAILGSDQVELATSGTVSGAAGTVTIRPDQTLVMENQFELVLLIGGTEEDDA